MQRFMHIATLIVLCLAGTAMSFLLLQEHLHQSTGFEWFDRGCGESDERGATDCDKVIRSPWGTFLHRPIAYWGMVYFSGLGLWFLFVGRPTFERRYWQAVPTLVTLAGAAGSLFFIAVMYGKMESRCLWCLITHGINFAVLGLTLLLWLRRSTASDVAGGVQAVATAIPAGRKHPSLRLVFAVALLAIITGAHFWRGAVIATVLPQTLYLKYQSSPRHEILRRPDELLNAETGDRRFLDMTIMGDFQCTLCREFSRTLETKIKPLLDNRLHVAFKHYPLCSDCNPHVKTQYNPLACDAARAAEAARMQGGPKAFWNAHDLLFEWAQSKRLGEMGFPDLVRSLNLDPDRFAADMGAEQVTRRIQEDVEWAHSLGTRTTPRHAGRGKSSPLHSYQL